MSPTAAARSFSWAAASIRRSTTTTSSAPVGATAAYCPARWSSASAIRPRQRTSPLSATWTTNIRPSASFRDPGFASLVGPSVTFKALWDVDVKPPAAVLMEASTGKASVPLLCEKAVGKGRVLLFTSSCDRSWTNFPIRPAYLPWVRQLAAYLTQEPLNRDTFHLTGDVVALTPAGAETPAPLRVKKPDGQYAAASWNEADKVMEFADADRAGVYTVETADRKPVGLFAVNTENYESKLSLSRRPARRQSRRRPARQGRSGIEKVAPGESAAGDFRGRLRSKRRAPAAWATPTSGSGFCWPCWPSPWPSRRWPTVSAPCCSRVRGRRPSTDPSTPDDE